MRSADMRLGDRVATTSTTTLTQANQSRLSNEADQLAAQGRCAEAARSKRWPHKPVMPIAIATCSRLHAMRSWRAMTPRRGAAVLAGQNLSAGYSTTRHHYCHAGITRESPDRVSRSQSSSATLPAVRPQDMRGAHTGAVCAGPHGAGCRWNANELKSEAKPAGIGS
jgi:hypothetical protein